MGTAIRMRTPALLSRPTLNERNQLIAGETTTSIKCAFFDRKMQALISTTGEVNSTDALAFVPAGTDVERRDQMVVSAVTYIVLKVIPGRSDRGVVDHIGLQLQERV
jgi:glycerol kinase